MAMTVAAIVETVRHLLMDGDGRKRAEGLTKLFEQLLKREHVLAEVKRLGRRPGVAFYLAAGDVKRDRLVVDVRVAGERCGRIHLNGGPVRLFKPSDRHRALWGDGPEGLDWRHARVRAFLAAAAEKIRPRSREATVESAFLEQLAEIRGDRKPPLLLGHQPITLGGLPFQFPLPVSGHAEPRLGKGKRPGYSDVLARSGKNGRRLRVFEVKKRGGDAPHALAQAVIYAATLLRLITEWPEVYFPALGYGSTYRRLPIDAVALVHESDFPKVRNAAEHLASKNDSFDLYAMLYRLEDRPSEQSRLVITCQELLGKANADPAYPPSS